MAVVAWLLLQATAGEDVLALLSITQAELKLRRETCMLLEKAGIATSDLVFWGDIDLDAMHAAKQLRLVLVDHNALQPKLAHLGDVCVQSQPACCRLLPLPHTPALTMLCFTSGRH